jgi:hypothetical protein
MPQATKSKPMIISESWEVLTTILMGNDYQKNTWKVQARH